MLADLDRVSSQIHSKRTAHRADCSLGLQLSVATIAWVHHDHTSDQKWGGFDPCTIRPTPSISVTQTRSQHAPSSSSSELRLPPPPLQGGSDQPSDQRDRSNEAVGAIFGAVFGAAVGVPAAAWGALAVARCYVNRGRVRGRSPSEHSLDTLDRAGRRSRSAPASRRPRYSTPPPRYSTPPPSYSSGTTSRSRSAGPR